ncbi:hypothetical protein [Microcoleus sp. OTE_8_concoct_300]
MRFEIAESDPTSIWDLGFGIWDLRFEIAESHLTSILGFEIFDSGK